MLCLLLIVKPYRSTAVTTHICHHINREKPNNLLFFTYLQWEAFSLPELSNFLAMLKLEYQNQVETIRNKYSVYKKNVEDKLAELKPQDGKT